MDDSSSCAGSSDRSQPSYSKKVKQLTGLPEGAEIVQPYESSDEKEKKTTQVKKCFVEMNKKMQTDVSKFN